jgi:hypothetical protein
MVMSVSHDIGREGDFLVLLSVEKLLVFVG